MLNLVQKKSVISFRIAVTFDVKIVWFGYQVIGRVNNKNANFGWSWFQKLNFDCLLIKLLICLSKTLRTQSSVMISWTQIYVILFLALSHKSWRQVIFFLFEKVISEAIALLHNVFKMLKTWREHQNIGEGHTKILVCTTYSLNI